MKHKIVCHICLRPIGYIAGGHDDATCFACAEKDEDVPKWRPRLIFDAGSCPPGYQRDKARSAAQLRPALLDNYDRLLGAVAALGASIHAIHVSCVCVRVSEPGSSTNADVQRG